MSFTEDEERILKKLVVEFLARKKLEAEKRTIDAEVLEEIRDVRPNIEAEHTNLPTLKSNWETALSDLNSETEEAEEA